MEQIFITITNNIANAIRDKYESFAQHAPYILGSIALFLFGWILAELASRAIIKTSDKIKLEWIADKVGLQHFLQRIKSKLGASHIIAKGVKGYLIFLFFIEATKVAKLTQIIDEMLKSKVYNNNSFLGICKRYSKVKK